MTKRKCEVDFRLSVWRLWNDLTIINDTISPHLYMPTNWRKNTPIAYKQGMSATRCPIVFENFHILIQGQCENTFYMSVIYSITSTNL